MKTLLNTKKALELKIIAIEVDCKDRKKTQQDRIDIATLDNEITRIEQAIKNKELDSEIVVEQKIEVDTIKEDKKRRKKKNNTRDSTTLKN